MDFQKDYCGHSEKTEGKVVSGGVRVHSHREIMVLSENTPELTHRVAVEERRAETQAI